MATLLTRIDEEPYSNSNQGSEGMPQKSRAGGAHIQFRQEPIKEEEEEEISGEDSGSVPTRPGTTRAGTNSASPGSELV